MLPNDGFLQHAEVADISIRERVSFLSVLFMVESFPFIIEKSQLENLETEFAHYQADRLETVQSTSCIDSAWLKISQLNDCNGGIKYRFLPKIMPY